MSHRHLSRRREETPHEYARRIGNSIPDGNEPLQEITVLYNQVRYGEIPAEDKQVDEANNLWRRLLNLLSQSENNETGKK